MISYVTSPNPTMRGSVKAGSDPLPADNTFSFVLSPERAVSVLVIDGGWTAR